jgi:Chaperone of endosialidase
MKPLIRFKRATLPVSLPAFVLIYFALAPLARAVVPPPDGGYPGGNTAEGHNALLSLTTGGFNTAVGFFSLRANTTGEFNTAVGAGTLLANTADENTATGAGALLSNTSGVFNTANGAFALASNTNGIRNTAIGAHALQRNTAGQFNTAMGQGALVQNTEGERNTAIGDSALVLNTSGDGNVAIGLNALESNSSGSFNTAVGEGALAAVGTGSNNVALGAGAGGAVTTASNVICIGHDGANVDNGCFISQIFGKPVGNDAVQVLVDSFGKIGTAPSSQRFKKEIQPMDKASEAILALNPVTFHYKSDKTDTPQFGLIAEEVAQMNPALVVHDEKGEIYTVRYEAINAMLLNEFLKEHRRVKDLETTIAGLKSTDAKQEATIANQQKQIEALIAGLQKISAELAAASPSRGGLELSKPALHPIVNNP